MSTNVAASLPHEMRVALVAVRHPWLTWSAVRKFRGHPEANFRAWVLHTLRGGFRAEHRALLGARDGKPLGRCTKSGCDWETSAEDVTEFLRRHEQHKTEALTSRRCR